MKQKKIAVIDYGMGNIGSVFNSLKKLGADVFISAQIDELDNADAYILPGVGAFPQAVKNLHSYGLMYFLNMQVKVNKKPFLGICLGMQLLAEDSEEQVITKGLGWIAGHVKALRPDHDHPVPHVGWNDLHIKKDDILFDRIEDDAHFFFDHSYRFICDDPDVVIASCEYGDEIVSVLRKDHIFATQFHPEKSQRSGLKMLRNFLNFIDNQSSRSDIDA